VCHRAISVWQDMCNSDAMADELVYTTALIACGHAGSLDVGKQVHTQLVGSGIKINNYMWNALICMYTACGDPHKSIPV